ncbi:MAG: hypothetical protein NZ580_06300, partial [Bacteroidia bacterium]|nr:hypothetical protein [Bacteroidia bacterium]MDW8236465.1 hypothetical protein [Bacteroidia bacterium]
MRQYIPWQLVGLALLLPSFAFAQDECGDNRIWYVVPNGGCSGGVGCGSRTNPATFQYALQQACNATSLPGFNPANYRVIRLATGVYNLNQTV